MRVLVTERRAAPRIETSTEGLIVAAEGACVRPCVIRNVSILGAQVELHGSLPQANFYLMDLAAGVGYEAQQVWRREARIGVRFLDLMILSEDRTPPFVRAALLDYCALDLGRRVSDRQLARK
jgi:hypothetical protein